MYREGARKEDMSIYEPRLLPRAGLGQSLPIPASSPQQLLPHVGAAWDRAGQRICFAYNTYNQLSVEVLKRVAVCW